MSLNSVPNIEEDYAEVSVGTEEPENDLDICIEVNKGSFSEDNVITARYSDTGLKVWISDEMQDDGEPAFDYPAFVYPSEIDSTFDIEKEGITLDAYIERLRAVNISEKSMSNFMNLLAQSAKLNKIIPFDDVLELLNSTCINPVQIFEVIRSKAMKTGLVEFNRGFSCYLFHAYLGASTQKDYQRHIGDAGGIILATPEINRKLRNFEFYPWDEDVFKHFPTRYPELFRPLTMNLINLGLSKKDTPITYISKKSIILYKLLIRKYPNWVTHEDIASILCDNESRSVAPNNRVFHANKSKLIKTLALEVSQASDGKFKVMTNSPDRFEKVLIRIESVQS